MQRSLVNFAVSHARTQHHYISTFKDKIIDWHDYPTCHATFRSPSDVKDHINTQHERTEIFVCDHDKCGKTFPTANRLTNHKCIHGKDRFLCKYCKKGFKHKSNMVKHEKSSNHRKMTNKKDDVDTDSE